MNTQFKLMMAVLPVMYLGHSAMAQEPSRTADAQPQKVARSVQNVSWTGGSKAVQSPKTGVNHQQPVDNDHDPRLQKLKIHDPNYTAAMSFE